MTKTLTIKLPSRRSVLTKGALGLGVIAMLLGLTGCPGDSQVEKREQAQAAAGAQPGATTQEIKNLKEKKRREEDPNAVRYLYLLSFGKPIGYYVTKGKISSNGSQAGPEDDIVKPCSGCDRVVVDSAQDDGSYGDGDPGIFFFTAEGVMVVTSLDYIQSDQPLALNVPKLNAPS